MDHPIDDRRRRCHRRRRRRHPQRIDVGFADVTYTDERLNEAIERFLTRLAVPLAPSPSPSPDLVVASVVGCPHADATATAAAIAAEPAGKEETRRWWG
jgi:hypothetical protein